MSIVAVQINGREYQLSCDDGQEVALQGLAEQLDQRVRVLAKQAPGTGDTTLMLLSALMLADELQDAKRDQIKLKRQLEEMKRFAEQEQVLGENMRVVEMEHQVAGALEDVARRVEKIATQLELH